MREQMIDRVIGIKRCSKYPLQNHFQKELVFLSMLWRR